MCPVTRRHCVWLFGWLPHTNHESPCIERHRVGWNCRLAAATPAIDRRVSRNERRNEGGVGIGAAIIRCRFHASVRVSLAARQVGADRAHHNRCVHATKRCALQHGAFPRLQAEGPLGSRNERWRYRPQRVVSSHMPAIGGGGLRGLNRRRREQHDRKHDTCASSMDQPRRHLSRPVRGGSAARRQAIQTVQVKPRHCAHFSTASVVPATISLTIPVSSQAEMRYG
jgi:hypothetical protein